LPGDQDLVEMLLGGLLGGVLDLLPVEVEGVGQVVGEWAVALPS